MRSIKIEPLLLFMQTKKKMAQAMRYRQLGSTNMKLSIISLGGSGYGRNYGPYDEQEAVKALEYSIDRGINYIDTAYWYGQGHSEKFLGRALQKIPRNKYFIATKMGRYELDMPNMFNFTAEKVTQSAEESLKRLQLDSVDLLQIHDVEFAPSLDVILNETLPAVERLKERGLCRYIGITGYPLGPLRELVVKSSVKIDSILSYCRLSLNDNSLIDHFEFFKTHRIPIINACAVGMGLLTETGIQDWHPALPEIKTACLKAVEYCVKHGVDISRLAMNYSTGFEEAVTTLVSMCDTVTVDKNLDGALRPLTDKEEEVKDYIEKTYFTPLSQRHWEGVEPELYWKAVKSSS